MHLLRSRISRSTWCLHPNLAPEVVIMAANHRSIADDRALLAFLSVRCDNKARAVGHLKAPCNTASQESKMKRMADVKHGHFRWRRTYGESDVSMQPARQTLADLHGVSVALGALANRTECTIDSTKGRGRNTAALRSGFVIGCWKAGGCVMGTESWRTIEHVFFFLL